MTDEDAESRLRRRMAAALELDGETVELTGTGTLASAYSVSDLAAASVATAAVATADLRATLGAAPPAAVVDRALADAWFGLALSPQGWPLPQLWDAVAGDYRAADGWIRLHTNAAHHRQAALQVLGVDADRAQVARAVARWPAAGLQEAVVAAGGCAAELHTPQQWAEHAQGRAVAATPLVAGDPTGAGGATDAWRPTSTRPLAGLRVLDLTRVIAGPVATRFLAGLGADVLRIDPPWWTEPALEPDMTLGKRTARLDLRTTPDRDRLVGLLAESDVLVHGYRPGALAGLGLGEDARQRLRPGLVDVSLSAYGDGGPWGGRRGFDSLVQMSSGIAAAGLVAGTADRPTPLPVQALDHATGYLLAAAALTGLTRRLRTGRGFRARLALARTALELEQARSCPPRPAGPAGPAGPVGPHVPPPTRPLDTAWGPARLLEPPVRLAGAPLHWDRPPGPLGGDPATW